MYYTHDSLIFPSSICLHRDRPQQIDTYRAESWNVTEDKHYQQQKNPANIILAKAAGQRALKAFSVKDDKAGTIGK
jgi:hypothetical protein